MQVITTTFDLVESNVDGQRRRFAIIPKFTPDVTHPTSIMRLRVSLAAVAFSRPLREFVERHADLIAQKANLREDDVRATVEFLEIGDELFQIMNSKVPITWSDEDDGTGTNTVIGLRDKVMVRGHKLLLSESHTHTHTHTHTFRWTPARVTH